jgi:Fe2+ or Zn2+ uptake regulation protein
MRKTKLLSAVTQVLQQAQKPITVPAIIQALTAHGLAPNKTTLYRMLEKMTDQSLVESLLLHDGITHYEIQKPSHGHFVCQQCNTTQCLVSPQVSQHLAAIQAVLAQTNKTITCLQLCAKGLCQKCLA